MVDRKIPSLAYTSESFLSRTFYLVCVVLFVQRFVKGKYISIDRKYWRLFDGSKFASFLDPKA